jgi:hypothetical protein
MAADVVCTNGPFKLALDFLEVGVSDLGVQIRLHIEYAGSFQRLQWTVEHCWIEYEVLRQFELDLRDGRSARLDDMSQYPLLHFEGNAFEERLTLNPPAERQSRDGEAMTARLTILPGSMRALHASLSEFAKWW